jgi:hypothetical protein
MLERILDRIPVPRSDGLPGNTRRYIHFIERERVIFRYCPDQKPQWIRIANSFWKEYRSSDENKRQRIHQKISELSGDNVAILCEMIWIAQRPTVQKAAENAVSSWVESQHISVSPKMMEDSIVASFRSTLSSGPNIDVKDIHAPMITAASEAIVQTVEPFSTFLREIRNTIADNNPDIFPKLERNLQTTDLPKPLQSLLSQATPATDPLT